MAAPPLLLARNGSMMTPDLKRKLREAAKARRRELAAATPDAGRRLADWLAPHLLSDTEGPVAGYVACNGEIDPADILERLHGAGRAIALPALVAPDAPLDFRAYSPGDVLEPGPAYGIPQPAATARTIRPAVLLVPLLAFDRTGHRLGYGGGFYDRTIAALDGGDAPVTIGLAYAGQEVSDMPTQLHDRPLDMVATETGPVRLRKPSGALA